MSDLQPIVFTRGVPASESFPIEEMIAATEKALLKTGDKVMQYGPAWGYLPLREWLAGRHSVNVDQILCANGSLQIIDFLFALLLKPRDVVFVSEPTYDRTLTTLRKHSAKVVSIRLQADGPDIEALEAALKEYRPKFFYTIPDFQNPAGATCSGEKRRRLVELGREHGYFYLEDAPYRPLRYRGQEEPSLFELAPDIVVHMSSFSKLIGPGPRMGYIIGGSETIAKMAKVAEDTYISPGYLAQGAVYEFCVAGYLEPQIEKLKKLYAPRLDATLAALDEYLPDAEPTRPDGGFFLSITLPEGVLADDVRTRALDYNLTLGNGRAFFVNGGERFLRLPYCAVTPETLDEGVSRLAKVVRELHGGG